MAFHIYSSGKLSEEGEKNQMNRLLGYLEQEFIQRNEECTIVIEPAIPYVVEGRTLTRHPDALIIKDNLFVLVDLKAYEGDIVADCSPGAAWKSRDGRELQKPGSINPFNQAGGHRHALLDFLEAQFVNSSNAPGWAKRDDYSRHDWIVRHVSAWVVTAEASIPVVTGVDTRGVPIDSRSYPSFKVLPLDRVPNALGWLSKPDALLGPAEVKRFLDALDAKVTTRTEWYRGAVVDGQERFLGLIPTITDWVNSGKYEDIDRSLKRIRELDLKSHLVHIIRIWHDKRYASLRQEALLILIDWQYERLGEILDEALRDEEEGIVKFALEYLSKYGYAKTLATLTKMLQDGPSQLRVGVLGAIAASGAESACSVVLEFAKKNLFDKPFKDFQNWYDRAGHAMHGDPNRSEYEEFIRLDQERMSLIKLCSAVINSLGDLNCKTSIPWLKRILDEPMSMGFESDAYKALEDIPSDYYAIFERTCKSLGRIGIGDASVTELFVRRLHTSPEDYQWCLIREIGNLGDQSAVTILIRFVTNRDSQLYDVTVSALSKLRSADAFDKLAESYLSNPLDDSGRWTGEALENIDKNRFENTLLKGIASDANVEFKREFLRTLIHIATIRSVDTLFPLLEDPILSYYASWALGNLISRPEVSARAFQLVHSENPIKQASAISVLGYYYIDHLSELSEFKGRERPVEVRRIVSGLYEAAHSTAILLDYAEDPDNVVRSTVFEGFQLRGGRYFRNVFLSGSTGELGSCEVVVDLDGVAIELKKKVLFLAKTAISRVTLTGDSTGRQGVYIEMREQGGKLGCLLVPFSRFKDGEPLAGELDEEIAKIAGNAARDLVRTDDENMLLGLIWSKVPSKIEEISDERDD